MRRPAALALLGALMVVALWGAASHATERHGALQRSRNLLLVTIDTWRWDYLSAVDAKRVRTPRLDALARQGVLLSDTRVAAPITLVSHASLFTGLEPPYHRVRHNGIFRLGGEHWTLAEILRDAGFQTGAVTGAVVLSSRHGLEQGFDTYWEVTPRFKSEGSSLSVAYPEIGAETVTDRALQLLERFSASRPWFLWVHYFDPHRPYAPPPSFAARYPEDPYAAEVAHVDHQLGRLVERLQADGQWAQTAVLVTSDHGESLGEHGEADHGHLLYEATVRVTTILRISGLPAGRRISERVRSIDLLPTVLAAFGLAAPAPIQGRSLWPLWTAASWSPPPVYAETYLPYFDFGWAYLRSLVMDDWKLIHGPDPELYHLADDPGERRDLAQIEPERLATLVASLKRSVTSSTDSDATSVTLSSAERRALASLGYLGGAGSSGAEEIPGDPAGLPNPKAMIPLQDRLWQAWSDYAAGHPGRAQSLLAQVLKANPGNVSALRFAAALHLELGEWDDSLALLERLAQHRPEQAWRRLYALAYRAWREGRLEEAALLYGNLLEDCPREAEAEVEKCLDCLDDMVRLELERGNPEQARRAMARFALDPQAGLSAADRLRQSELLRRAGMPIAALSRIERLRQELPMLSQAHLAGANLHRDLERPEEARAAFQEAVRLDPESAAARIDFAAFLSSQGDYQEAIIHLRRVLESDPNNDLAVAGLGLNLHLTGDSEAGVRLLEEALALDPDNDTRRLNLARVYLELGQRQRAQELCREVLLRDPDNSAAAELLEAVH